MIRPFAAEGVAERSLIVRLRLDQLLVCVLLPLLFAVRVFNLEYNTLFVDEAIYAVVGRDLLAGIRDPSPLGWMYGSYLYPALAGLMNELGGVIGLRALSALFSTLAAAFVYLATVRLFGGEPAVWATVIFGLTAISINTGQFAVYDAPVIPALAAAFYLIVRAAPPRAPAAPGRGLLPDSRHSRQVLRRALPARPLLRRSRVRAAPGAYAAPLSGLVLLADGGHDRRVCADHR
jgi:hypothetical protein